MAQTIFAVDEPHAQSIPFIVTSGAVGLGLTLANIEGWHVPGMLVVAIGLLGGSLRAPDQRFKNVTRTLAAAAGLNAVLPVVPWVGVGATVLAFCRPRMSCATRTAWLFAVLLAAASVIVVGLWWSSQSGLAFYTAAPPEILSSRIATLAFIILGSLANSFFEEAFWRHHLPRLRGGNGWFATAAVLALLFGLTHLDGLPWGGAGLAMASAFGLAQSCLVRCSGGALGPAITVHFVVDCVLLGAICTGGL